MCDFGGKGAKGGRRKDEKMESSRRCPSTCGTLNFSEALMNFSIVLTELFY